VDNYYSQCDNLWVTIVNLPLRISPVAAQLSWKDKARYAYGTLPYLKLCLMYKNKINTISGADRERVRSQTDAESTSNCSYRNAVSCGPQHDLHHSAWKKNYTKPVNTVLIKNCTLHSAKQDISYSLFFRTSYWRCWSIHNIFLL